MRTSSLFIMCMTVIACDVSPVPIAPVGEAPFDSALLGVWHTLDPYAGEIESGSLTVLEFRAPEYYIELIEDNELSDIVRVRGFITRIGNVTFMNADELTMKPRGYTFYRYSLAGDTLIVAAVSEASQKFTTSDELRAFMVRNLDTDSLYGESARFVRVKAED